jgi:hypothetical protein
VIARHAYREVAASHRLQCLKQFLRGIRLAVAIWFDFGAAARRWRGGAEITHERFPSIGGNDAQKSTRSHDAIFLHDKIVQTAVKQAKYPRYYRLLAGRIRLKEIKAATEQLFPRKLKILN